VSACYLWGSVGEQVGKSKLLVLNHGDMGRRLLIKAQMMSCVRLFRILQLILQLIHSSPT
jgi:hypothetical protein